MVRLARRKAVVMRKALGMEICRGMGDCKRRRLMWMELD